MFPPLCCIGSRQLNAPLLKAALSDVLGQLGFQQHARRARGDGGMPAGMWDLGDRGAWIYIELLPFAHNAQPITRLIALRLSASLNLPLEVLLIDSLSGPVSPDADEKFMARVAYLRHRVYPNGQLQPLRHPIADRLVGERGYEGEAHQAPERILHAIIQSEGLRCEQQMALSHRGTPRQVGLLVLLAETMGQPLRMRRRKAHFELEMPGSGEEETLVHFLRDEDIRFLRTVSPRFARLPLDPA